MVNSEFLYFTNLLGAIIANTHHHDIDLENKRNKIRSKSADERSSDMAES